MRRQAIRVLRERAASVPPTPGERVLLAQLERGDELPIGLTIERTIEDPVGRVFIERIERQSEPVDVQGSLFDQAEAA